MSALTQFLERSMADGLREADTANWGRSLTPQQVNFANFGATIDHVDVRVHYGDRPPIVHEAYDPRPFTLESIGASVYDPEIRKYEP